MAGYVYGGTEFDAHLPLPPMTEPKVRKVRDGGPAEHGTRSGYVAHRKAKQDACRPCKDANQAYNIDYEKRRAAREIKKGWTADKCGTLAGYSAHRRHAIPVCAECRKAATAYDKELREKKEAA